LKGQLVALVEDWLSFCRGASFSPDHFADLFQGQLSFDDIKAIYSPFEQGEAAAFRLRIFFEENSRKEYWRPNARKRASKVEILEIASSFKVEVATLLAENDFKDLGNEIVSLPVSFIEDSTSVEERTRRDDIVHVDYVDCASDIFRHNYLVQGNIMRELKEAIYRLTTSLDVTRYLLSPLTSLPNSFDEVYRFWSRGGVYCFTNDAMEVSVLAD
jgi:hypothetical protein